MATTVSGPAVACFASGTLIRTATGEVPVEALCVGHQVIATDGAARTIKWIGKGSIDFRAEPGCLSDRPILIAGALGEGCPCADLILSPGHRVCLDVLGEVFVAASDLINGCTVQQSDVDSVTYWHVELSRHEVIFANGQPAESYQDAGNRSFFGVGTVCPILLVSPATHSSLGRGDG